MLSEFQHEIVASLEQHVQKHMPPDPTGHDWPHVWRVLKNAEKINQVEKGDIFQITLIALTHDLYDHKFFNGTQEEAEKQLLSLLINFKIENTIAIEVVKQVFNLSFKKGQTPREPLSKEGKIVQDADRIEAIGAIGIARAFAYGGFKNRLMNHEKNQAVPEGTTFDHFFEKLLKLYDLLNTQTAKEMAKDRFDFMQEFAKRFEQEWNN